MHGVGVGWGGGGGGGGVKLPAGLGMERAAGQRPVAGRLAGGARAVKRERLGITNTAAVANPLTCRSPARQLPCSELPPVLVNHAAGQGRAGRAGRGGAVRGGVHHVGGQTPGGQCQCTAQFALQTLPASMHGLLGSLCPMPRKEGPWPWNERAATCLRELMEGWCMMPRDSGLSSSLATWKYS